MAKRKRRRDGQQNLEFYKSRIENAEAHRDRGYKELWIRCYKRWRNFVDQLKDSKGNPIKDRSNISIPYTFTQVETIHPRLVETVFAGRPYVTYFGREPLDEMNADNMTTLVDWQSNERMDLRGIFSGGLKELCIFGTAVTFTGWKLRERKVIHKELQPVYMTDEAGEPMLDEMQQPTPMLDPSTQEPIHDWQPVEASVREYDDPEVKFIDLGDFFVDPNASDICDARYCGHVDWMTKEAIQELVDEGIWNVDWSQVPNTSGQGSTARQYRMSSVGLPPGYEPDHTNQNNLYEVHKYWEDDKHVVIINRTWVAAEGENPFWHKEKPYSKDVYCEVPHEFYGMGIVEMCEDLQDELNNERNTRIDFRSFLLRRMFKVRRGANVKRDQLVFKQGGVIEVDEMDDVEEFGVRDAPASSFNQEQLIKQDMQDATGGHDVVMGTVSGGTATEAMRNDNNAAMRFKLVIGSVEKKLLCGVARLMAKLNQQFVEVDKVMRIVGKDGASWVRLSPEDIQGEFDLMAVGSSVEPQANKEAFKQRMVELYSIASKDPFYQQFPDLRRELLKKLYDAFDIKDTDKLLPSDQQIKMMMMPPPMPGAPMMPPGAVPPGLPAGGGVNTAPMQEPALQLISGGGGRGG